MSSKHFEEMLTGGHPNSLGRTEEVVELVLADKQSLADEDELLIRVSKGMKRTHIDKSLNRIFKKHIEFEKGRQTRNPNRSNARYSLSKPIAI